MKRHKDSVSSALGFASWVFTGRGKSVTLFQVLVVLPEGPPAGDAPGDPVEGEQK